MIKLIGVLVLVCLSVGAGYAFGRVEGRGPGPVSSTISTDVSALASILMGENIEGPPTQFATLEELCRAFKGGLGGEGRCDQLKRGK